MIRVGLTGGIGSGKSLIAKIFEKLHVPVFYADTEAKILLDKDPEVINNLKANFGYNIYKAHKIDKAKLASIIFNNDKALETVNQIVHPKVRENFTIWAQKQNTPYVIMEAAILFESGGYKDMDGNILVYAPEALRIQRVIERDNTTAKEVKSRIQNQQPDEKKLDKADWILYNDATKMLLPQIIELDQILKNKKSHYG